jgi:hypothetical protein
MGASATAAFAANRDRVGSGRRPSIANRIPVDGQDPVRGSRSSGGPKLVRDEAWREQCVGPVTVDRVS